MNIEQKAKLDLYELIKGYVQDGWSDIRIREFLHGGIEVNVDDDEKMMSYPVSFPVTILTEEFMNDLRASIAE